MNENTLKGEEAKVGLRNLQVSYHTGKKIMSRTLEYPMTFDDLWEFV